MRSILSSIAQRAGVIAAAIKTSVQAVIERIPSVRRRPLAILAGIVGAGLLLPIVVFLAVAATLPPAEDFVREGLALPTRVYARDGTTLLYEFAEEHRDPVAFAEIPKQLVEATISAEDRTFWTNPGVDVGGIVRAALRNVIGRDGRPQGASTITQQLVKQRLVGNEVSLWRKMREAVMAIKITARYSKQEILELYLNQIYYGDQAYGVKAAARAYFGSDDLSKLTLAQTALLVGLPQSPSRLDPTKPENVERAQGRRSYVLEQMLENGAITKEEKARAEIEPMIVSPGKLADIHAPHFVFQVKERLAQILGSDAEIARGGYTVVSTLDWAKQQEAEKQITAWVDELHAKNVWNAALVSIDPKSGEVLAYVGSVSYFDNDPKVQGKFDVAGLGYRQPGSAFKVFNYVTALKKGATPATVVVDARTSFGGYMPQNADGQYHGPITMRQAIRESRNVPAVKFLQQYSGIEATIATARAMGVEADYESANPGLALTLGAVPIRLIDMTSGYAVLANMGERIPPELMLEARDRNGHVIYRAEPHPERVLTPEISWLMNDMLKDTTSVSPIFASWTYIGRPAALKTGTTDDLKDVYAVGYTPQVVTGVWMGNSDGSPMSSRDFFSAMGPGQLWRDYMKAVLQDTPVADWQRPAGIVSARVVAAPGALGGYGSGLLPTSLSPFSTTESFVRGAVPQKLDDWSQEGCAGNAASPTATPSVSPASAERSNVMVVKEAGPDAWRPYTQAWVKDAIAGRYDYGRFPWSKLLATGEPCPSPSPSASPTSPSSTTPRQTQSPRPTPSPQPTPTPTPPGQTPTPKPTRP